MPHRACQEVSSTDLLKACPFANLLVKILQLKKGGKFKQKPIRDYSTKVIRGADIRGADIMGVHVS